MDTIKDLEKICIVFGGHLIFINFPLRKWEGYYAYSSIVAGFLHLYVGIRYLPLLHIVIYVGLVEDRFRLVLYCR